MSLKFPIGVNSVMPGARWTVTRKYSFSCGGCEPWPPGLEAEEVVVVALAVEGPGVGEEEEEEEEKDAMEPRGEWGSMTMLRNWNWVASVSKR